MPRSRSASDSTASRITSKPRDGGDMNSVLRRALRALTWNACTRSLL
jgi:hypothetical protein